MSEKYLVVLPTHSLFVASVIITTLFGLDELGLLPAEQDLRVMPIAGRFVPLPPTLSESYVFVVMLHCGAQLASHRLEGSCRAWPPSPFAFYLVAFLVPWVFSVHR